MRGSKTPFGTATASTGCPNKFGIGLMWYSEAQKFANKSYEFSEKMNSAPKNCFFSLFCKLQKSNWNFSATFLQLSYVVIYLVNCLILEKSGLKIHYHFLQFTKKGWISNFLEHNTNFFVNDARFAHKAYSKLVGTPCRRRRFSPLSSLKKHWCQHTHSRNPCFRLSVFFIKSNNRVVSEKYTANKFARYLSIYMKKFWNEKLRILK